MFAPKFETGKTIDNYLDLIYRPQIDSMKEDSNSSFISDNNSIPTAGITNIVILKKNKNCKIEVTNKVVYLPLADTIDLIQKMMNFPFLKGSDCVQKIQAESLLKNLYNQLKQDMIVSNQEKTIETSLIEDNDDDIFTEM
ncbi:13993_t:CDS:2 [Dentiscutata erythropus]|uniref:13993_t:CDS:1 n=1 Tax=Dentiscutata erythropus TaxID=1348616 RepID=A0A9N9HIS8_9GLOM|nr:13993_t:CDS:2 [Dentiscutata erythropus]